MKSLKKFALLILLILTAWCAAVGFSACGNSEENEDKKDFGKGISILFASDEDCPDGNIQNEYLKSTMDFKINKTYYFVIDYTFIAEQSADVSDRLCAKISLLPAANVSATLEETASGNFTEEVIDDEMNINISYRAPENAGDKKRVYIVVRFKPLRSEITYIGTSIYLKSDIEKSLVSRGVTLFDNYADGLKLTLNSDRTYSVNSIDSTEIEKIIIPSTYKNLNVTGIGDKVFENCENLKSINMPDSVTSIGESAFRGCSGLPSVAIPDSVTSIGDYAFYGCKGLTSVTIGSSVSSIGDYAFYGCKGLTSVNVPDRVESIGKAAFSGCSGVESLTVGAWNTVYHSTDNCIVETASKTLILGCKASVIPSDGSITSIGNYAFSGCSGLKYIKIPDSVTDIDS